MHMTSTSVWSFHWTTILLLLAALTGNIATCASKHTDTVEGGELTEATEDGHHQEELSADLYQRLDKLGDLLNRYDTGDQLVDIGDPEPSASKRNAEEMGGDEEAMWYGPRMGKTKKDLENGPDDDSNQLWFGPRLGKRDKWFGPRLGKRAEWFGPRLGKRAEWFGPRLGKRSEDFDDYDDDNQENLNIDQFLDAMRHKRATYGSPATPNNRQWWGPVARRSPFVPRLGKRGEEHLEVEEIDGLQAVSPDNDINLVTRAAFSPRLGKKNMGFAPRLGKKASAFAPRLGKKNYGFAPRLGKRQLAFAPRLGKKASAFAPRLGKRAGLAFAPRLGRSYISAEEDKRSAFSPRLGRSPAFAPRLGRSPAFAPRLG